ncbi:hypothetical protein NP493_253g02040 [Ridgeia piscesae]|uniref:Uncharacterized protein n=1 Tax=Ridgeia piscesae TaxID=27915 RepID=A0AAD9NYE8_RIDPI|nr:hypothetical protein NP493_253g02040 [Ridgeia piscesae]
MSVVCSQLFKVVTLISKLNLHIPPSSSTACHQIATSYNVAIALYRHLTVACHKATRHNHGITSASPPTVTQTTDLTFSSCGKCTALSGTGHSPSMPTKHVVLSP